MAAIGGWFLEGLDYGAFVACEGNIVQGDATRSREDVSQTYVH